MLNPIAIELYQGKLETVSITTITTPSLETTTDTTTTSGEASTTEPTIGMGSVYSLGAVIKIFSQYSS